jgi:PAS domain S-box-containing protein
MFWAGTGLVHSLPFVDDTRYLLAAIVESSEDAIVSKNLNGIVTSWNKAAERLFGYTAEEIIGRPITVLAVPERLNEMPAILQRIRQGERVEHYETLRRAKDGRLLNISLTISPIRNADGAIIGASKIARDITQQKRMEEALLIQSDIMARSNIDLQEFAYVISHDLQEPLRTITAFSQLLQQRYPGKLDEDADEFIGYVTAAAARMSDLIRDLLAYSRLNDGAGAGAEVYTVSSTVAVEWALANLERAIADSAAVVDFGELPDVKVDKAHLVLLFQNLIGNAVKYRSAEPPRIHIEAGGDDQSVLFSVSDNGIGIAKEYHQKIFGLFKRLHGNTVTGTGMGLAVCRKIVERYGGKIWVDSEAGQGSTFRFVLPRA